ncbi:helix-turn-helix domain-containing protein [Amycolatopsis sp. CA-230715]|uniref:helix-turn-helix domain-containing protein n=1 Tax=Amycolatopsis sp. CA-230715 TaxID=2745196 RepID=UPI001C320508|nr:helix-turn-helix domain-containing protein [Amycolatopsis sp. CA-230715]QWF80464.1 hypothetical protein HUW46_03886 [Amycolatopsis sp. CA-230715]
MDTAPLVTAVPPRHLYRVPEAMRLLALSRSVIYELMRAGRLKFVKEGRATRIPATAIKNYLELLDQEAGGCYGETA